MSFTNFRKLIIILIKPIDIKANTISCYVQNHMKNLPFSLISYNLIILYKGYINGHIVTCTRGCGEEGQL